MILGWVLALAVALAAGFAYSLLAALEGRRPFLAPGVDPATQRHQGAGGDPRLLAALADDGFQLASLGDHSLGELRVSLERSAPEVVSEVAILRGRLINNLTRRGVPGFRVTPLAAGGSTLRSARGDELVPAITDREGRYTLVGLPRSVEVTNLLERPGFLELAYTTCITYPADYLQDYVGTVPAYLARPAYGSDPLRPFAASRSIGNGRGELALTVVWDRSLPDADDHGFVTGGKYEAGGVAGVTFRVWETPAAGADPSAPARTPELGGVVYADSLAGLLERRLGPWVRGPVRLLCRFGLRRLLTRLELPATGLAETSPLGLALVRSLPEGLYEIEASHPTLECLPTRDAWRASDARRARVEIVAGTLGDVRFFCVPPGDDGPTPGHARADESID